MPDGIGFSVREATKAPMGPPALGILKRNAVPPPALPLDVFGPFWSAWITDAAEGSNAPPDFTALPLLALASALIGNARWVKGWPGWIEPPVLWCASVGEPSSGKSAGASPIVRDVLRLVEQRLSRDHPDALENWHEAAKVSAAIEAHWEKEVAVAVKSGATLPPKPPEAAMPSKPIEPRASVADTTLERLAVLLEGLPKGVLHRRDELAGWFMNLSRYSGGTDRPFWLEAYNGGPYTVDRQSRPDPLRIARLSVAMFGTIQPDKLAEVLIGADDGLASRFLWCWPEPFAFKQPTVCADIEGAAQALERLADLAMMEDADGYKRPSYVSLCPAGAAVIEAFGQDMQHRERQAPGLLKSAIGKARGQVLRLALTLEFLWWSGDSAALPEPAGVSLRAMRAAAGMMEAYFLPMAERVLGDASVPEPQRNARTLAVWIARTRPDMVNVTQLRDHARLDGLREAEPIKDACRYLAEAQWLAEPGAAGRGRPRGDWTINPALYPALGAAGP